MKFYIALLLMGLLTQNFILSKFLGIAAGMSAAVIFVMLLSTAVCYPINLFLENHDLAYLQTIVFILVIAALVQFLETVMKKYMKALYRALGIYLPLITTNCAVLGVVILNVDNGYNFPQSMVNSLAAGLGFGLAMILFAGVRGRLENNDIPKFMEGLPVTLVAAALVSLSFLGFSGIIEGMGLL